MKAIRVLLVDMPGMQRDLVERMISGQSDMTVVGALPSRELLPREIDRTAADVVVLGASTPAEIAADEALLFDRPRVMLMELRSDGRTAHVARLRPERTALLEVSPGQLLEAIRAAVPTLAD